MTRDETETESEIETDIEDATNQRRDTNRTLTNLASLKRSISPPVTNAHKKQRTVKSVTALVEAGEKNIENHLSFFSEKLWTFRRSDVEESTPRLAHQDWIDLYTRNQNDRGHHFVVHQHDHPIAGTHYDLRLQCNATSSISFAIMYGLPGNPNSRRLNRNATETRVHNLWNHLVETASHQTGSMIIWDTGEYEVLPYQSDKKYDSRNGGMTTDEDDSDRGSESAKENNPPSKLSEPEKLHIAFQSRKIRLRLHGTRLPTNYTISLRLTKDNFRNEQPKAPKTRRRKTNVQSRQIKDEQDSDPSMSDSTSDPKSVSSNSMTKPTRLGRSLSSLRRRATPPPHLLTPLDDRLKKESNTSTIAAPSFVFTGNNTNTVDPNPEQADSTKKLIHDRDEAEDEESRVQKTNTYPGQAQNTIGSIYQRRWYLSLDRAGSGFYHTTTNNKTSWQGGFHPFYVLGRDAERSIVTGRLARDVLDDEGVVGFVPRNGWRGVVE